MSYSQNEEEKYILDFFNGRTGTILDVGANDGQTFSNSRALINVGWSADLVDPSPTCFKKLSELYKENSLVRIHQIAISDKTGSVILHDSGTLINKGDHSLVSTIDSNEKLRWGNSVDWSEVAIRESTYKDFLPDKTEYKFITIDAEGMDLTILKQIDLTNTELLCIEWNSIESIKFNILHYCSKFGMNKLIHSSAENLLICRP